METEAQGDLKATLRGLIQLQGLDAQILAAEAVCARIPLQIAAYEKAVKDAEAAVEAAHQAVKTKKKELDAKNLDLKSMDDKIANCEKQLNEISTNDAYKAMLGQIAGYKADKSRVEDEVLQMSYTLDEMGTPIEEAKKAVEAAVAERDAHAGVLEAQQAEKQAEIDALREQRTAHMEHVDPETHTMYSRVLKLRKGSAMAEVIDEHCQGCMMGLNLQEISKLTACREVMTCRTCHRILYLPEVVGT